MAVKKIDESGSSNDSGESNVAGKIKVGDKEFGASDIENLLNQQETATKKTQKVAAILSAAEKYGVDVDTYLQQAEGAFDVMSSLIQDKIIDERGNVIKKQVEPKKEEEPKGDEDLMKLFNLSGDDTSPLKGADKIAAIVAKALEPQLGEVKKLAERVSAVDKTQGDMIRLNLEEKVMGKYPNLSRSDVSQVFGSAMADKSKSLWEHAEMLSKVRGAELGELRKKHAEEFGIDLEKFDENKIREQGAEGGAGSFFQGKKFSFNAKGEDAINPKQAAIEFVEAQRKGS